MWLINVYTYKLELCLGHDVWQQRPYAILSHTWENEEVTFQDMQDLKLARDKAGFWKIEQTCEQAKQDDLAWAWVDTCCIDKTSSAELQEAINSMFLWYAQARQCYAYLSDVGVNTSKEVAEEHEFRSSRWFTRGWTLQELLAPPNIRFFGKEWRPCGSRAKLKDTIAKQTGIDIAILGYGALSGTRSRRQQSHANDSRPSMGAFSVAKRMSWAANRTTTRVEDRAYSLLGIFGVNMPLLYGEGTRAFVRLQEDILRTDPDLSVLLWEASGDLEDYIDPGFKSHSLLAPSPRGFAKCGTIQFALSEQAIESAAERTISSVGLKTRMRVVPEDHGKDMLVLLDCYDEVDPTSTIALCVKPREDRSMGITSSHAATHDMLYLTPRAIDPLVFRKGSDRTVKIDSIDAEAESTVRVVVLAREEWQFQPTSDAQGLREPGSRKNRKPMKGSTELTLVDHGVQHVWIRMEPNKSGPPWEVLAVYPRSAWNLDRLTFDASSWHDNIMWLTASKAKTLFWTDEISPLPFMTGAIALKRYDVNNSRVVISFACLAGSVGRPHAPEGRGPGSLYFRIDSYDTDAGTIDHDVLTSCCEQVVNLCITDGSINTKGVQLYEGTGVYDGSALIVKDSTRMVGDTRLGILQVFEMCCLDEIETLQWKFSNIW